MSEKEMFELTTPQKSIWMMEQFYKGTNINNICATLTINMDVDMEKLNKALNDRNLDQKKQLPKDREI